MKFTKEQIRRKLESLCAYQERCLLDVKSKFLAWEVPLDWQDEIIEHLLSTGYLNEVRFAESYVSGKFRIKKWGRRKIIAGLKVKGVSSEVIQRAIEEIDPEAYWETLLLLATRQSELLKLNQDSTWEKKVRVIRFLVQRGYENDLVLDAVEKGLK